MVASKYKTPYCEHSMKYISYIAPTIHISGIYRKVLKLDPIGCQETELPNSLLIWPICTSMVDKQIKLVFVKVLGHVSLHKTKYVQCLKTSTLKSYGFVIRFHYQHKNQQVHKAPIWWILVSHYDYDDAGRRAVTLDHSQSQTLSKLSHLFLTKSFFQLQPYSLKLTLKLAVRNWKLEDNFSTVTQCTVALPQSFSITCSSEHSEWTMGYHAVTQEGCGQWMRN